MTAPREEKRPEAAPFARARTDAPADMRTAPNGSRFGPEDCSDADRALEALARWDELDRDTLAALERHPVHGHRLERLRAAERWLEDQARAARATSTTEPCPSADELYDFARGPGYVPVDADRRRALDHHVHRCLDCEQLVQSLSAPPPLPLDLSELTETSARTPEPAPVASTSETIAERASAIPPASIYSDVLGPRTATRGPRRWVPLAAAAAVLVVAGTWVLRSASESRGAGPRPDPLLRGRSAERLLFPRERVLAPSSTLHELFPALGDADVFEVAAQPDAQSYRVELSRHDGGAFAKGAQIASASSLEPRVTLAQPLAAGNYTWSAWVTSRGLEEPLGARDFEVVELSEVEAELAPLAHESDALRRTERALEILDRHGLRSDARALARTLPAGELRERWLAPIPGR